MFNQCGCKNFSYMLQCPDQIFSQDEFIQMLDSQKLSSKYCVLKNEKGNDKYKFMCFSNHVTIFRYRKHLLFFHCSFHNVKQILCTFEFVIITLLKNEHIFFGQTNGKKIIQFQFPEILQITNKRPNILSYLKLWFPNVIVILIYDFDILDTSTVFSQNYLLDFKNWTAVEIITQKSIFINKTNYLPSF